MFLQDRVAAKDVRRCRNPKGGVIATRAGLYIVYPDGIGRSKLTGS
jgi:hypothetical protein